MVITVHCTSCWTAFPVDTNKVPPKGVSARCSVCSHVFRVERPPESEVATDSALSEAPETPAGAPAPDQPGRSFSEGEGIPEEAARRDEASSEAGAEADAFGAAPAPPEGHASPGEGEAVRPGAPMTEDLPEPEAAHPVETPRGLDAAVAEAPPEQEPHSGIEAVSQTEATPEEPLSGLAGMEAVPEAEATPEEHGNADEETFAVMEEVPGLETTLGSDSAAPTDTVPEPEPDAGIAAGQPDGASPEAPPDQGRSPTSDVGLEAATPADAWVFEREPDLDPTDVSYEPVGTLEEELAQFGREADLEQRDASIEVQETFDASLDFWARQDTGSEGSDAPPTDNGVGVAPVEPPESEPDEPSPRPIGAFTLGRRDPAERARRLARVLVSDMIMYNPERHQRALASGTLESDFEDEIAKSWKEYVEQVGRDVAESTDYWRAALNDVLAGGRQVF